MLIPNTSFAALKNIFLSNCSTSNLHGVCDVSSGNTIFDNNNCFSFTASQLAAFPTIQLYAGKDSTIVINFPVNAYLVIWGCLKFDSYCFDSLLLVSGPRILPRSDAVLSFYRRVRRYRNSSRRSHHVGKRSNVRRREQENGIRSQIIQLCFQPRKKVKRSAFISDSTNRSVCIFHPERH